MELVCVWRCRWLLARGGWGSRQLRRGRLGCGRLRRGLRRVGRNGRRRHDRPAGQLLQRRPWHPQHSTPSEPPGGPHVRRRHATAGKGVRSGATDAQHARGFLDGQEVLGLGHRCRQEQTSNEATAVTPSKDPTTPRPPVAVTVVRRCFDRPVLWPTRGDRTLVLVDAVLSSDLEYKAHGRWRRRWRHELALSESRCHRHRN